MKSIFSIPIPCHVAFLVTVMLTPAVSGVALGQTRTTARQAAQSTTAIITSGQAALHPDEAKRNQAEMTSEIVREIDDPSSGTRWLLYRNPVHPGGPGRLVPLGGVYPASFPRDSAFAAERPIIRTGDHVILEESTPVLDARLSATALNPAPAGGPLRVRLDLGGQIVAATAVAPGRVALVQPEAQR